MRGTMKKPVIVYSTKTATITQVILRRSRFLGFCISDALRVWQNLYGGRCGGQHQMLRRAAKTRRCSRCEPPVARTSTQSVIIRVTRRGDCRTISMPALRPESHSARMEQGSNRGGRRETAIHDGFAERLPDVRLHYVLDDGQS